MTVLTKLSFELAEARAKLYHLLSLVYAGPPDKESLQSLAEWVAAQAEDSSRLLSSQMKDGLATLGSFFKEAELNSREELQEAVSVEFTRILRGVKQGYSPPPPYESVYREEGGRVFGELSIEVQREYRRFGLELSGDLSGEPPDHLSFELEFLCLLCSQEAEAWKRGDEAEALKFSLAEKEFSEEHLLTWLPEFCDRVKEFDRLNFFRGFADLTEGWVIFDYQQHLREINQ